MTPTIYRLGSKTSRLSYFAIQIILPLLMLFLFSCDQPKSEFSDWRKKQSNAENEKSNDQKQQTTSFFSTDLLIDTIYRSMQGPYEIKEISVDSVNNELIWITGYESRVLQAESKVDLGPSFMCHNNLNYAHPDKLPWKLKTSGANHRIFTLSQGQTKIEFPKGFGIPIPANQPLKMVSQVLNHHRPELYINTRHQSKLKYLREGESEVEMTPLYQQAVFVTKQIEGAEGAHGLPLSCAAYHDHNGEKLEADVAHDCSIEYDEEADYNPYRDKYGRKFTGHWVLPKGKDTLRTRVTKMMDLAENSSIHCISVHLHPFAEALELWDLTKDSLLYAAAFQKDSLNFGFKSIDYFRSESGIPVYADHEYELISAYNCTDSLNEHTAMAVMYLYLRD